MPDDYLQEGLRACADQLERSATVVPAEEIRRRAARRHRNQVSGAALAVALVALSAGLTLNRAPDPELTLNPADTPSTSQSQSAGITSSPGPRPTGTTTADTSQLQQMTVDLQTGVLLDIADDGVDRWLQYRNDGTVDFTGTTKNASTEMVLYPAPATLKNSVQIVPKALGNQCVTATQTPPLKLTPCAVDDDTQIWRVIPAGDSGVFELEGKYGIMRADEGLIVGGQSGRSIMQTIRF